MGDIGDVPQTSGEPLPVHLPVADSVGPVVAVPPVGGLLVPAGVKPEDLRQEAELLIAVNKSPCIFRSHASIFIARRRIAIVEAAADRRLHRIAPGSRIVMPHDELPEDILSVHSVLALPRDHRRQRSTYLLARQQIGVQVLKSGRDSEAILLGTDNLRLPGSRPTDGEDHAAFRSLDVEIREADRGRTTQVRNHDQGVAD